MTIGCDTSTPLTSRFDIQVLRPDSAIFDTLFDPTALISQSNPLDRVDRQSVVDLTNRLNVLLGLTDLTPYPTLKNRFDQFPITYVETADFILTNQIDTGAVYPVIRDYNPSISMPVILDGFLGDFDFHLDANIGNTIAGGLCGQFGNIFQKLLGIFTLIDTAKGLIDDIKNLAEKDPLKKAKSLTLQQVLVALKAAIVKIVKKLVEQVKRQIEAMVKAVVDTITEIAAAAQQLYKKLKKMADDIVDFFKDASVEKFLDRIEKFISSTASQFERLTAENVALLMFRFCQFTELLQALLMGPAKALTALAQTIAVESLIAKNSSLKQTKAAVEAGATRVSPEVRTASKEAAIETNNSTPASAVIVTPIPDQATSRAVITAPTIVTAPPKVSPVLNPPQVDWQTPREATGKELALVNKITAAGIPGKFTFSADVIKNDNWKKVQPVVWVKLLRVCELSGKSFVVTSSYRSKSYNRSVGGASNSMHMSGYAIDIQVSKAIRDDVFIAAERAGFTGIGIYSTFMHLDCGSRRMWVAGHGSQANTTRPLTGSDKTKWVEAIAKHNADLYRKNSGIPAEQLAQQNSIEKKLAAQVEAARRSNNA
jgi:uncharacterized protein YcbK (DUF882 family)